MFARLPYFLSPFMAADPPACRSVTRSCGGLRSYWCCPAAVLPLRPAGPCRGRIGVGGHGAWMRPILTERPSLVRCLLLSVGRVAGDDRGAAGCRNVARCSIEPFIARY